VEDAADEDVEERAHRGRTLAVAFAVRVRPLPFILTA